MSTPTDPPEQPRYGEPDPYRPGDGPPAYGGQQGYGDGQQGYGGEGAPPAYDGGYQRPEQPQNGLGTAALVVGIVAVLSVCVGLFLAGVPAVVIGIVGVVLGVLGRRRVKRGLATNGGAALTGLILSAVSLVLGIATIVLLIVGLSLFGDALDQCQGQGLQGQELTQCLNDNR